MDHPMEDVVDSGRTTQLTDLPNELLYTIFEFVAHADQPSKPNLRSLSLTSNLFRSVSERLLYRSFAPTISTSPIQRFTRFLEAIARRPARGLLVKSVKVVTPADFADPLTKEQIALFTGALLSPSNPHVHHSVNALLQNPLEAQLYTLLFLAPNLESFSRCIPVICREPNVGEATTGLEMALLPSIAAPALCASLRTVTLGFQSYPLRRQLAVTCAALALPALQDLYISGVGWRNVGHVLGPRARTSSATNLTIADSEFSAVALRSFLQCFKGLRSFKYSDNFVIYTCCALDEIVTEVARCHSDTLESLEYDPRCGSLNPILSGFPCGTTPTKITPLPDTLTSLAVYERCEDGHDVLLARCVADFAVRPQLRIVEVRNYSKANPVTGLPRRPSQGGHSHSTDLACVTPQKDWAGDVMLVMKQGNCKLHLCARWFFNCCAAARVDCSA